MPITYIENQDSNVSTHQTSVRSFIATIEGKNQVLQVSTSINRQGNIRDYLTAVYYSGPQLP